MSTLTKTAAELTQQNLDSSSTPTVRIPRPGAPGASPNPSCVEIPVRLRGLQADAAAPGAAESADAFTEDTQTLILFPRGAVVRLAAPVKPGQELILTNLKSQQNVHCKVVSVRASETAKGYVELEFTHRTAGFWGHSLVSPKPSPSASAPVNESSAAEPAPAAALQDSFGGNLKPPFDAIAQSSPALARVKPARMQHVPAVAARAASPASGEIAKPAASAPSSTDRRPRGPAAAPKLDMESTKNQIAGGLQPARKWFLTGASIAASVLALTGGIFFFQSRPAIAAPARANSATQAAAIATVEPQVIVVKSDAEPASSSPIRSGEASSSSTGSVSAGRAAKPHLSIGSSKLNSPAAASPLAASSADDLSAASTDESAAPGAGDAIPSGVFSSGAAPIAPPVSAPTPPRAISIVRPQYPDAAKAAHIEGEVTIQADIDASGRVLGMQAITGPAALRSAALEALHQWRYEPARLDGQPVAGQVVVTLKFRLQ